MPQLNKPIVFQSYMEHLATDGAETEAALASAFRSILETTSRDYGFAVRAVHAKGHALVRGELEIAPDLPAYLAQGLFAHAGKHGAILRFSTNPGDLLDDAISVPRGLALKVLDVSGERLADAPEMNTQDFLMANGRTFGAAEPKAFLTMLQLLARTTDRGEELKKLLTLLLGATQSMLHLVGQDSNLLARLGGAPNVHPLGETYFSQTPFLYGRNIAKFSLEPASYELRQVKGMKVHAHARPDALREDIAETLIEHGGVWHLNAQICTDLATMPIEDPTIAWDEELAPFERVATLTIPPQLTWTHGSSDHLDQRLAFSAWNGLADHRPLGAINRVRKHAYRMSSEYRAAFNHCPVHETAAFDLLPA
jgi:hypothetical protein